MNFSTTTEELQKHPRKTPEKPQKLPEKPEVQTPDISSTTSETSRKTRTPEELQINSRRTPEDLQKNSKRTPEELQKKKKIPKELQKNSKITSCTFQKLFYSKNV